MAEQMQLERARFRLIVTRRTASEVLLLRNASSWQLPCVEIPLGARPAKYLVAGVRGKHEIDAYCLWTGGAVEPCTHSTTDRFAFMEARSDQREDAAHRWVPRNVILSETDVPPLDRDLIRVALDELDRYSAQPELAPFARPAWIEELLTWVQSQLDPLGVRPTGKILQLNASATFSLIRLETTGAAVWFKATGAPNAHERAITVTLHDLFPRYVPRTLAVHPSWNGWLYEEAPGLALGDCQGVEAWARAAQALAELEISSVMHTPTLLRSGCKDLTLPTVLQKVDPFLARMRELMARQTKSSPTAISDAQMDALGERIVGAIEELQSLRLPATLGHRDPNSQNIVVSPNRCFFLDWAEGCVTHPLFTFEYLREHAQRSVCRSDDLLEEMLGAYLRPWQALFTRETLLRALEISPLLAVFTYAVGGDKWRSSAVLESPTLSGFLRSLTRRAWREAERLAVRSTRCPV